tara:strand:- start:50 stop:517 length:468 start_codon:yes stop_codon:yes gene_type:complete
MDYFLNKKLDEDIKRHGKANLEEFMSGKDEDEQDQWLSEEALLSEGPEGDYPTHHFLYNEDYFKTYSGDAEDYLGSDAFDVIRAVKEYEEDNFGEIQTDLSDSVKVANMYAYIRGEELMDELASNYKRDRINDRKRSDRNNNKMFDSGNDFKFKQ